MESAIYVIEIPFYGDSDIRLLTKDEHISMKAMELEEFNFWRHDGEDRFWAYTRTAKEINNHGFSMTDQYSKSHGCHVTDFVDRGNGIYEYYEEGFDRADEFIDQFGSFLYFSPEYFWGSNGCQILPPSSDLFSLIPSCFVNLIASKGLLALSVTSDINAFLYGYLDIANGINGEDVKIKATQMGLIKQT